VAVNDEVPHSPELARHWALDPDVTYLNHGAFGACPWPVLAAQSELRARIEREPIDFLDHELERRLDEVRERLAEFIHADPASLAFVPNATTGVNTVLRSLAFEPGDEILTTDHEYNACLNAARFVAAGSGARVVEVELPFPVASPDAIVDALLARATERTRLALISHVTSPTALVLPIEAIVAALAERGIDTLVDGAHAPGMIDLDLDGLGAAYYTGNAHKWLCSPKGAGFLHVRIDRQATIRPLVISHGANSPRADRSRFLLEFDWLGTVDPTPFLVIPAAIDFVGSLLPGGWPAVMAANRGLVLDGRRRLLEVVRSEPVAPDEMIGSIAAIELPADLPPAPEPPTRGTDAGTTLPEDPLRDHLRREFAIEVPVYRWPHTMAAGRPLHRLLRVSAQLYNSAADYERLAAVLAGLLTSA
jgi:isopenicillin-N epimerase